MTREITIGKIKIGKANPVVLIAGPCVIENERSAIEIAMCLKEITVSLSVPFIFKASYDKANRSSLDSFRGPGIKKGLAILKKIKDKLDIPVLSDVHCQNDLAEAKKVLDVIQIPAFLSRQTDLIVEAARTGKVINIKKGQFLAPWDMVNIIKKVESCGNKKIIITERGVSFGYNNLVSDLRALAIMQKLGYPVVYDATHSVQLPGGRGASSGGERGFVEGLSRAAVAFGCNGLFLEVHKSPEKALCDGPNSINLPVLKKLLKQVKSIQKAVYPVRDQPDSRPTERRSGAVGLAGRSS
ncbi:MAG: 3-deoxy-8-phosphooctulonate synthase [Candidatus Omnitrophota bacterium]|nr:3-deoxy-8-phosphooctulonate synthase [Candidatus Omnitrophota bacterium]